MDDLPGTPGYLLPLLESPSRWDPGSGISECGSKRFILVGKLILGWLKPLVGLGPRRQQGGILAVLIYVFWRIRSARTIISYFVLVVTRKIRRIRKEKGKG